MAAEMASVDKTWLKTMVRITSIMICWYMVAEPSQRQVKAWSKHGELDQENSALNSVVVSNKSPQIKAYAL